MAARVKIDFGNIYELEVSPDLKLSRFNTLLENGDQVPLKVQISNDAHELMTNVYNLSFGPLNKRGKINDRAALFHNDYSRVFSTILLSALTYLKKNPQHYLGVDGSDNNRAYFYFRAMIRNFDYLNRHFTMYGMKYFVRISRLGKNQYDNPFDFEDVIVDPYKITSDHQISQDSMYNYFVFGLNDHLKTDQIF
jgi:hypothetical protein